MKPESKSQFAGHTAEWETRSAGNTGKFFIVGKDRSYDVIAECPSTTSETERNLLAAAPALLRQRDELREALGFTNLDSDHEGQFCNCPLADGTRPDKDHATSCLAARQALAHSEEKV